MIFNSPLDVSAGNNKRKRLIQQMQARGSMRGSAGIGSGAGAGLLARLSMSHRPMRPSITNPHAYDMSDDLRGHLGVTMGGGHGIGPDEGSPGNGIPVPPPHPIPGQSVPQATGSGTGTIPFNPTGDPVAPPQQTPGGGVRNLGGAGAAGGPMGGGGVASPPPGSTLPTDTGNPSTQPLAPGGGQSGLIPMGNGQYWDPTTNQIVYPGGGQGLSSGFLM